MNDNDNVDAVKAALAKGANINHQNESSGQTPLMGSLLRGKLNIFEYLLNEGADVTIADGQGYTPPHGAAFQGQKRALEMLIEKGVDVNVPHRDGYVPLIRACLGVHDGHYGSFKLLVEHGVHPFTRAVAPTDGEVSNEGKSCLDVCNNDGIKKYLDKWSKTMGEVQKREGLIKDDVEYINYDDDDDDDDDDNHWGDDDDIDSADDDDDDDDDAANDEAEIEYQRNSKMMEEVDDDDDDNHWGDDDDIDWPDDDDDDDDAAANDEAETEYQRNSKTMEEVEKREGYDDDDDDDDDDDWENEVDIDYDIDDDDDDYDAANDEAEAEYQRNDVPDL